MRIQREFRKEYRKDQMPPMGWFAVSPRFGKNRIPKSIIRSHTGTWMRIKNTESNESIYRVVKFNSSLSKEAILIDHWGWLDLQGRENSTADSTDTPLSLLISPIKWYQKFYIGLKHPEPSYRLATQLAILSLVLGIVSLVLAMITLFD